MPTSYFLPEKRPYPISSIKASSGALLKNFFMDCLMPGLVKNNNVTMKRGKFEGDLDYKKWFEEVANDRAKTRRNVIIRLLNEKHEPVWACSLSNAFALKYTDADLKSDANEVAIESMEVAHEGLKVMQV